MSDRLTMTQGLTGFVIAAIVVASLTVLMALPTSADHTQEHTIQQLQEQIAALTAQLAALTGSTPSATACNFTRNLSQGVSGEDVRCLQQYLNSVGHQLAASGAGSPGNETMFFGPRTRAAVASWQAANNVSPAVGFFGPISRATYQSLVSTTPADPTDPTDPTTPPGDLQGNEGSINVTDLTVGSVEIDLGSSDTVYEFEVEAQDSDIAINRVDFHFTHATSSDSAIPARPWLYFSQVELLVNGSVVATLSGSGDFTEITSTTPNTWRARFSGLNEIVRQDDTSEVSLRVSVLNSMQSDREDHEVVVELPSDGIRYVDGAGINQFDPTDALDSVTITFNDTFGDGDLDVTLSDDSPQDLTILVDEDNRTNNVEVLVFDVEAKNSDVTVNAMDVVLTNDTGTTTIDNMVRRVRVYAEGQLLRSITPGISATSGTSTLSNLDYTINEGNTVEFVVEADFYATSRTGFNTPASLEVTLDEIRAEDSDFESITKSDLAIGAGEVHSVIEEGLTASIVSKSAESQLDGEAGKYTFVIDLTAHGDTFRVATDDSFSVTPTTPGSATATTSSSTIVSSTASSVTVGSDDGYRINNGQTRQFTVEVFINEVSATGQYRITLDDVTYGTTTFSGGTGSPLSLGSPDFRSPQLTISSGN